MKHQPMPDDYEPGPHAFVREQVERYEKTDGREGGMLLDRPVIIVAHRGAKTGKLRKTPLMKVTHESGYLIVASEGGAPRHPLWYFNLKANPVVEVRDGATTLTMLAREVGAAAKAALWPVCDAAWPQFPDYRARTTRDIPMFHLTPFTGRELPA